MGLAIQQICESETGPYVVITEDIQTADRLAREVKFFSAEKLTALSFPDWETLPYDSFSPHQDIVSQRLKTLYRLSTLTEGVLFISISTLMQRLAPPEFILGNSLILKKADKFDPQQVSQQLTERGYHRVDTVYEHGEFAIRGSIMDIYPMGNNKPYRVDVFDDEIDQLRMFDPETQLTIETIASICILPANEFPLNETATDLFRQNWRTTFDVDPKSCPIYQDISASITPAGVEYYLPLFFDRCVDLFSYLPDSTRILSTQNIDAAATNFREEINERYEQRRHDITRPILEPAKIYLSFNELMARIKNFTHIKLTNEPNPKKSGYAHVQALPPPKFNIDHHAENPLEEIASYLENSVSRILFCAESAGRREVLLELLQRIGIKPVEFDSWTSFIGSNEPTGIVIARLDRGLHLTSPDIVLISETQLFGQQVLQRRRRDKQKDQSDLIIKSLAELQPGSPVVHIDHGVGRYRGMETLTINDQDDEFLVLEYADQAKLYIPIASLQLISRYTGASEDSAPLHKLGSNKWQRAKRKAAEQVNDTAAELLEIHARRAARKGFAFDLCKNNYQRFCMGFPFEETPDQLTAIENTIADMLSEQSMDRLICGDVGFGKTEVAMRAAFVAADSGRQVALLVPTTLLAQQHFESFKDRFADWPINIEVISRFRSKTEQDGILKRLGEGQIDIIIGTHKLLSGAMRFNNLGLLIIDEEHRFGVRQKEKIKALRAQLDILTLTATPIPRTLNMAMAGVRDISIISSPPLKRLSIKTFALPQNDPVRKEAITRELLRGGQVYLLHNDVSSIEHKAESIAKLIPEARVGVAHGQMRERELEQKMADFYHNRFNVLVCTTIIETGIDIPSANTIIIERADKFGLAQLHQLRGRVGRSHHQAYAYLLTPNKKLSKDATKRIDAIINTQELGAGFTLATHDMEIRGAGELLGENQSGQIHEIGFSLYAELLELAIDSLKKGTLLNLDQPFRQSTEINLHLPALIPEHYLPDVHARLIMYKRIANAKNNHELKELKVEMIDRFGLFDAPISNLFEVTRLKLKALPLGIRKLEITDRNGKIEFDSQTPVDPKNLIALIQQQPAIFKLDGADRLRFNLPLSDPEARINKCHELLDHLAGA
jgi:transcription-repair coupling factor (superfamily II helicase)